MLIEGNPRVAWMVEQPGIIGNLRETIMGCELSVLYYDTYLSVVKARVNIAGALRGAGLEDHNRRYRQKGSNIICL